MARNNSAEKEDIMKISLEAQLRKAVELKSDTPPFQAQWKTDWKLFSSNPVLVVPLAWSKVESYGETIELQNIYGFENKGIILRDKIFPIEMIEGLSATLQVNMWVYLKDKDKYPYHLPCLHAMASGREMMFFSPYKPLEDVKDIPLKEEDVVKEEGHPKSWWGPSLVRKYYEGTDYTATSEHWGYFRDGNGWSHKDYTVITIFDGKRLWRR